MHLKHLSLVNFRNYVRLELDLPADITLLQGDNAQGKTNLLEAIYYLATTRSLRVRADREVINWLAGEEPQPFARLVAQVQKGDALHRLEITLLRTANGTAYQKKIRFNGLARRALDVIGQVNVVLFRPEDIDLVTGSPGLRRRYLDATICQLESRYCRTLQTYERVRTQRNHLLRSLRERHDDPNQLYFWDQRLAESGAYLIARRQEVVARLDDLARATHLELTGGTERLKLCYEPGLKLDVEGPDTGYQMPLALTPSPQAGPQAGTEQRRESDVQRIGEAFLAQLREIRPQEILRGMSLIGPHRDDLRFLVGDVDMGVYGSRGQQRTISLALKLAEVELMRRETGEIPILLLDDVMSELDQARRSHLMGMIDGAGQVLLTTTDPNVYRADFLARVTRFRVQEGRIERLG
jgi:DNA replication and repair protein RecF